MQPVVGTSLLRSRAAGIAARNINVFLPSYLLAILLAAGASRLCAVVFKNESRDTPILGDPAN